MRFFGFEINRASDKEEKERAFEELDRQVSQVAREFGVDKPNVLVETGTAEAVIWRTATERKADLVVMGLVGRTGFHGFWVGDTADRILPDLPCSILTVRPREAMEIRGPTIGKNEKEMET